MKGDYVVNGLVDRRGRLAGELDELHKRVRQTIADIEHLDATIKQFAPGYRLEGIRSKEYRPPSDWSRPGEMTKLVLDTLRRAAEPLTSRDVALVLMREKGMDPSDHKLMRLMVKRAAASLRIKAERGVVVRRPGVFSPSTRRQCDSAPIQAGQLCTPLLRGLCDV